jgi:hypothetical protein
MNFSYLDGLLSGLESIFVSSFKSSSVMDGSENWEPHLEKAFIESSLTASYAFKALTES